MKNLLKQRDLNSQDKLIILHLNDNMLFNECKLTSQDIANDLGLTRKKVIDTLDKLVEMDLITCIVKGEFRSRTTKFTDRLLNIISEK